MTYPLPAVIVDPASVPMTVAITSLAGATPTVYSDANGINTISMPAAIMSPTRFYLPAPGSWQVESSVGASTNFTVEDNQVASVTMLPPNALTAAAVVMQASGDTSGVTDARNLLSIANDLAPTGGKIALPSEVLYLPPGVGGVPAITIPGGVTLQGSTVDYSASTGTDSASGPPSRGSIIRAAAGSWSGPLVRFGAIQYPNTGWQFPGNTGGGSSYVIFDAGTTLATSAVQTWGPRSYHHASQFWGGTAITVDSSGQNSRFRDCIAESETVTPYAVQLNAHDCKWLGGEVRCAITAQCLITPNGQNFIFEPDDCYGAGSGFSSTADGVLINLTSGTGLTLGTISGRIDVCSNVVHVVFAAGVTAYNLQLKGLRTYDANGWLCLVDLTAAGGAAFQNLLIEGTNDGLGTPVSSGGIAGLVALHSSVGSVPGSVVRNNVVYAKQFYGGGFRPTIAGGNIFTQILSSGSIGTVYQDEQTGTGSLTGAPTTLVVNHSILTVPSYIELTPTSAAAVGCWVSASSTTTFTVTFAAAPGGATATFNWRAAF